MLIKGSPENNFFDDNPEVRYISPFANLLEKIGEEKASQLLWGIYLLEDERSDFSDLTVEERELQVKENFFGDSLFDLDTIKDIREAYVERCMSKKEQLLRNWKRKLEERDIYVMSLRFGDDPDLVDKLLGNTEKLWSHFFNVEKEVIKERQEVENRGGYHESLIESGKIK